MASQPSGSKPKKGIRSFLKETLHVRSRSKSPSQPSNQQAQQPEVGLGAAGAAKVSNQEQTDDRRGPGHTGGSTGANIPRVETPPNAAWAELGVALKSLKNAVGTVPALVPVIDLFLPCLGKLERLAKGWSDYERSATDLAATCNSLEKCMKELDSGLTTNAVLGIVLLLKHHVANLQLDLDHEAERDTSLGAGGHTDVEASYKLIQESFRQLEANLSVSPLSTTNEEIISKLLEKLNPAKHSTHDSSVTTDVWRTCAEDTRTGTLTQLDEWAQDPTSTSVCWISGTQGIGKTTITRTFCERLDKRKLLAASFICGRVSPECSDPTRIVPTIAYQLSEYSIPFRRALYESLPEYPGFDSTNGLQQFEQLIHLPLAKSRDAIPSSVVVVINGLDECGGQEGQKLMRAILDRYANDVPLRFLVTSRQKPEADDADDQTYTIIHLDDIPRALVRHDLEQYFKIELRALTPTPAQLEKLVDRTDMLFICAAVLVRFILLDSTRSSPHERLELILSMTVESTKKHAYIDALYATILRSVLEGEEMEENKNTCMRMVLWTVLFAQESIGVDTIATLAGIDDLQDIRSALRPLRPVLHQSEENGLVLPLHASFPEFMLNSERSGAFFYNIAEHSRLMAERCFGVMEAGLRFNICNLESSFVPDRDVKGLEDRIKEKISATLGYACRHWATHLELAAICDRLMSALEEFLLRRLSFWMEVLNLRKEIGAGVRGLMKTSQWLKITDSPPHELGLLVRDSHDFVTRYAAHSISESTPHIYLSALPFCSSSSQVYKNYSKRTTGLLEIGGGIAEYRQTTPLAVRNTGYTISSIAYAPDGNLLAFGYKIGAIGLCDAHDGSPVAGPSKCTLEGVMSVAFSPDGSKLAAGSEQGTIQVWNVPDWEPVIGPLHDHTGAVTSIAFSPDGTLIASGSRDTTVRIWRVKDGARAIGPLDGHSPWKTPVAFSPDGTHLASGSAGYAVRVWDIREDVPTYTDLTGHTFVVSSLAFTPDGTRLVSGSWDNSARVWSTSGGAAEATKVIKHSDPVNTVAVLPNGKHVASAGNHQIIRVWDIEDGAPVAGPFAAHQDRIESIAVSPEGTRIASGADDYTVRIWGVYEGVLSPTIEKRTMFDVSSAVFSPTESSIYFASRNGTGASLWDLGKDPLATTPALEFPPSAHSIAASSDGGSIAVFLDDYSVEVVSTMDGKLVAGPFHGHSDSITSAAFSSDDAYLATGSEDCTVRVWSMNDGGIAVGPLVGHTSGVRMVALSSDGSRAVSCSSDGSIRVWNVRDSIIEAISSHKYPSSGEHAKVFEGWTVRRDGWVVNHESSLLFWAPLDFPALPSPHTEVSVARQRGTLMMQKQRLFVGPGWDGCYNDE